MTVRSRWHHKLFGALALMLMSSVQPAAAWEPTQPVEFIVPAGTGGGADQMARVIQDIIAKHHLMLMYAQVCWTPLCGRALTAI